MKSSRDKKHNKKQKRRVSSAKSTSRRSSSGRAAASEKKVKSSAGGNSGGKTRTKKTSGKKKSAAGKEKKQARRGNRLGRLLKRLMLSAACLIVLFAVLVGVMRLINYLGVKCGGENGIDEGIYVTIGEQEQYLSIRGEDVSNPVILWLHGGPASPDGYLNYAFTKYLTDEFTFVSWDQRGCGRTYYENEDADPENLTATFDRAYEDLTELTDYLCESFDKEKIIIAGHSYGTILGSRFAMEHPEKVLAYIGVGQAVCSESEKYSYEDALSRAKTAGYDISELLSAYRKYEEDPAIENLLALRAVTEPYHAADINPGYFFSGLFSPDMGIRDLSWYLKMSFSPESFIALNSKLFDSVIEYDIRENGLRYEVPVGFISGSQDWVTPVRYAREYCESIDAPKKAFTAIEGCGHIPQLAEPEIFSDELRKMINDLTGRTE